jgi:flagellin
MMSARSLSMALQRQDVAMNRLSSGYRINSAKDDAAGLQISNRLLTQESGLAVAMRNANDGMSIGQVAEGALQESSSLLQRMRELALQSANGSYSDKDRVSLNKEYQQLIQEINRISQTSTFAGKHLLDGSFGTQLFQIGANRNETIALALPGFNAQTKFEVTEQVTESVPVMETGEVTRWLPPTHQIYFDKTAPPIPTFSDDFGGAFFKIESPSTTTELLAADYGDSRIFADAINDLKTGIVADASTHANFEIVWPIHGYPIEIDFELVGKDENPVKISASFSNGAKSSQMDVLVDTINAQSGTTGIEAWQSSGNKLVFINEEGHNIGINDFNLRKTADDQPFGIEIKLTSSPFFPETFYNQGSGLPYINQKNALATGEVTLSSGSFSDVQVPTNNLIEQTKQVVKEVELTNSDILTQDSSQSAITDIDIALSYVDGQRASIGAFQNRLSSTISNLVNIKENISTSIGRIKDTDFAKETASLTKAKIISEAGTAILAQANKIPQNILKLLE